MQETWETQVQSLGQEDPVEEGMATHSSVLAQRIPWTEEPGELASMESQSQRWLSDWAPQPACPIAVVSRVDEAAEGRASTCPALSRHCCLHIVIDRPEFHTQLSHLLIEWPWPNCLTSVIISSLLHWKYYWPGRTVRNKNNHRQYLVCKKY